jgi:hypothetical protein
MLAFEFSRPYRNGTEEIVMENPGSIRKTQFDSKNPVKILIHGYRKNSFSDFPHIVKDGKVFVHSVGPEVIFGVARLGVMLIGSY